MKITEGKVEIFASVQKKKSKTRKVSTFYNEQMEFSRDISVAVLSTFLKSQKLKDGCDCLSASGIRGLRYTKECKLPMILNDFSSSAVRSIKKNVIHNKLRKKCKVEKSDASILLRNNTFGFIDIDPFGSPVTFLDSATRSVWHRGLLAVTATDTAPLSGTFPLTCLKKYGIKSIKTPFYSELGLRILITNIILTAAKYDKAFVPILSHATSHYFRTFGKIEHLGKIKSLLKEFGYVSYCNCGRHYCELVQKCKCKKKIPEKNITGPIYLGPIQNKIFVKKVAKDIKKRKFRLEKQELKLLDTISKELDLPFYYDLHKLAKKKLIKLDKTEKIIKKLKNKGYQVSRTHFCPTGLKTDWKV